MKHKETLLKVTDYNEILNLRDKRLRVTDHKQIFSLDDTGEKKIGNIKQAKDKKETTDDDDDDDDDVSFLDYIKEIEQPLWYDLKKLLTLKQKRISCKRAKENLHSKEDFPLVRPARENLQRPRRQKLPYCRSEVFASKSSSCQTSFFRRWHHVALPRFTIYSMTRKSSLRFDRISSMLSVQSIGGQQRSMSEMDFERMWKLNELLNKRGSRQRYGLKSHLRQHKEDSDVLELLRIYTAGLKKAPPVDCDSDAAGVKPSLKYVPSLEVLDDEKAFLEVQRNASLKSVPSIHEVDKKKREPEKFEQKPSVLPDFKFTGEEQFRVIVYDDEVPYLDFDLDEDTTTKGAVSDIDLFGMGDFKITPEDIDKPVMLKFKNMPELLGWFRRINKKNIKIQDNEAKAPLTEQVRPKRDFREIVVKTPLVGLRRFKPLKDETGVEFKKLDVTTHDAILSIVPKSCRSGMLDVSESGSQREESMASLRDQLSSSCAIRRKPPTKSATYKTKSAKEDRLQRIKSSIVNEVVKKVASYFTKNLKPKLEESIKQGQCRCCQSDEERRMGVERSRRLCACNPSKPPNVSKGVSVDINDLSNDTSSLDCPPKRCHPNVNVFACPTMTYFRNTGVNANGIGGRDGGSSGDSLSTRSFDCQEMLQMYEGLAKIAQEQMQKLRTYEHLAERPTKDVKFCKTVLQKDIASTTCAEGNVSDEMGRNVDSDSLERAKGADAVPVSNVLSGRTASKSVSDYITLDSSSSSDCSVHTNLGRDPAPTVKTAKDLSSAPSVCKSTGHKRHMLDDTYNVPELSDFECYINYMCTHSEKFFQIADGLTPRKLRRQTSLTNLVNLHGRNADIQADFEESGDLNNNVQNHAKDLVMLFRREPRKNNK